MTATEVEYVECRTCHGTGEVGESGGMFGPDTRAYVCPRCQGLCKVTPNRNQAKIIKDTP